MEYLEWPLRLVYISFGYMIHYKAFQTPTAVLPRKAVSSDDGIYLSELEAAGQFKQ